MTVSEIKGLELLEHFIPLGILLGRNSDGGGVEWKRWGDRSFGIVLGDSSFGWL